MWYFRGLPLSVAVISWATALHAAEVFQQNRIVTLDRSEPQILHVIDMDLGTHTPVSTNSSAFNRIIAVDTESVFLLGPTEPEVIGVTQFDMRTGQTMTTRFLGELVFPFDLDVEPNGNLLATGEFGMLRIDPKLGRVRGTIVNSRLAWLDDNYRTVEIDSSGAVITDFTEYPRPNDPDRGDPGNTKVTHILRQRPGVVEPDIIQFDVRIRDYALFSDQELFGIDGRTIYRFDLEAVTTEPVWESDAILGWADTKIEVDSLGRLVVLNPSLHQLVRIDLGAGTEEVMQLDFSIDDFAVIPAITPALVAGDADLDLDFDQFDLVQVQVAAKYLTGLPATWGQGDWNGAPGGSAANPPVGDGLFNQNDIVAALSGVAYLTGPYAAVAAGGVAGDKQASLIYDPRTGELAVDGPAGTELTSINIDSAAGIFTGDAALQLGGSFDNDRDTNIFKATFGSSFGSLSFGNVAQVGLEQQFLLSDLTVVGSLAGGGPLGEVDLIYVPEPSTLIILVFGSVGIVVSWWWGRW